MNRLYPWVWIAWIAWLGAWEGLPIITGHDQYTLSDYVWRLEDLGTAWTFLRYLIAAMSLWLFLHLTFGWLR
jgi:hypothetical protein